MAEYETQGHMVTTDNFNDLSERQYFMQYLPVIKEESIKIVLINDENIPPSKLNLEECGRSSWLRQSRSYCDYRHSQWTFVLCLNVLLNAFI